jgi:hypothetical protein
MRYRIKQILISIFSCCKFSIDQHYDLVLGRGAEVPPLRGSTALHIKPDRVELYHHYGLVNMPQAQHTAGQGLNLLKSLFRMK